MKRSKPLTTRKPLARKTMAQKTATPKTRKPAKLKKCRNTQCLAEFAPLRLGQKACSIPCSIVVGREEEAKKLAKQLAEEDRKSRAERRAEKEKIKTIGEYAKQAQDAFNAWVRERDYGQPCISCGTTSNVQYAAGHYRTVGACKALRFEPLNVHRQCNRNCNSGKSGNIVEYRIGLVKKIGLEKVEWLEGPHETVRYTVEDYKAIGAKYRALRRELVKARERGSYDQA